MYKLCAKIRGTITHVGCRGYTPSSVSVVPVWVAIPSGRATRNRRPRWTAHIRVLLFGELADNLLPQLRRGDWIEADGELDWNPDQRGALDLWAASARPGYPLSEVEEEGAAVSSRSIVAA
jgi:hypothetical protein